MLICLCFGVSDKEVARLVANGVHDLESLQEVCRAGKKCGTCVRHLEKAIDRCVEGQTCSRTNVSGMPTSEVSRAKRA